MTRAQGHRGERPSLTEYVERRNGTPLGGAGSLVAMLHRSLGADSFAGFWRNWNPVWSYYLSRFVNAPARRFLPGWAALLVTFGASGAIHDAAVALFTRSFTSFFTTWFVVLGLVVLGTSRIGLEYRSHPWAVRAAVNLGIIAACLGTTLVVRRMVTGAA